MISQAKIISCNMENERVCACAARISTTSGDALELFEKAQDSEKNAKLIKNVLKSGHKSLIEHAVFTLAMQNVTAVVEEFFIEFRLASFTVKSRRYVDFRQMGYYVPPSLSSDAKGLFRSHVDSLFADYDYFLEQGVPKEDARFVLPYCFFSNFYMTVNGRELLHMLSEMLYGRGKGLPELETLAEQIISQLEEALPCILPELRSDRDAQTAQNNIFRFQKVSQELEPVKSRCELVSFSENAEQILLQAYQVSGGQQADPFEAVLHSRRPRELEQITATYVIRDLSLSSITHMVRHRMQSVIIPSLTNVDPSRFILPASISEKPELEKRYRAAFGRNADMVRRLREMGFSEEVYLCLSGNVLDVFTTMNGRELATFFRLRCCMRAQWEIREIAIELLNLLREKSPAIFKFMGPSCYMDGACPEGRLTCGRITEVREAFALK